MINVTDLSKFYGSIRVLKSISFDVSAGEVIGLLGPNGAGKTTMMKILTGYLQPDDGEVVVDGLDVLTETNKVQSRIGYLPENAPLYPELSVQSYLKMIADIRKIPRDEMPSLLSEAIRATGLVDMRTRPIGQLSKGYRQRVGLAQAIVHKPKLLILDEPTVGLDPTQILEARRLIKRLSKQSTVIISTHILSEVEAICDRVMILLNGEIKADSPLTDLSVTEAFVLVLEEGIPNAIDDLMMMDGVDMVDVTSDNNGEEYRIKANQEVDLRQDIYELARTKKWPLRELRRDVRTLEMIFNDLATASSYRSDWLAGG